MAVTETLTDTDASLLGSHGLESSYREINDLQLHVVAAGDPDDPLVVLLHGHPDFWYGWRNQIGPLVDAGFRVAVPDQRGCNLSDAPDGIDAYRLSNLAADVCELILSEGQKSAHIVGHDFGGFVAWNVALRHSSMVDRLGHVRDRGRVHARTQVFLSLCLRLVVAITNYERGDNSGREMLKV